MNETQFDRVREKLFAIGWRNPCDAQSTYLRDALPELRALLNETHSESVPLPKTVEAAKLMTLLGTAWLKENAPQELKPAIRALRTAHRAAEPVSPTSAGEWVERARRYAEDFADECVNAGYVATSAKSLAVLVDFLQSAALAKPAGEVQPVTVKRGDDLHKFLDAAGAEGLVLGGVDAGDLFTTLYTEPQPTPEPADAKRPWFSDTPYQMPTSTPGAPVGGDDARKLLTQFERCANRFGELWERRQGKGWPEPESSEFKKLRDVTIPALRNRILAATPPQAEPWKQWAEAKHSVMRKTAAAHAAGAYQAARDIRTAQGWKLTGEACPVLYTDSINGKQVMRDDLWLATTAALRRDVTGASDSEGGEPV